MSSTADHDPLAGLPARARLDWHAAVLVCGDCERRDNGPHRLQAKQVKRALKAALRASPRPWRVLVTGCLGPCMKKAMTVAALSPDGPAVALALRHADELPATVDAILHGKKGET